MNEKGLIEERIKQIAVEDAAATDFEAEWLASRVLELEKENAELRELLLDSHPLIQQCLSEFNSFSLDYLGTATESMRRRPEPFWRASADGKCVERNTPDAALRALLEKEDK